MILDLNDPDSIITWWQVAPHRHGLHLIETARRWPQFAWPIRTALRRINADPDLARIFPSNSSIPASMPAGPMPASVGESASAELQDTTLLAA